MIRGRIAILFFFSLPVIYCQMNDTCDTGIVDFGVFNCAVQFEFNPFPSSAPVTGCESLECFLKCIDDYIDKETVNCTIDDFTANTSSTFLISYRAMYRYLCDVGEISQMANENCNQYYEDECQRVISNLSQIAFALNEIGDTKGFKEFSCRVSELMINCMKVNITDECSEEMVDFLLQKKKIDQRVLGCVFTRSLLIDEYTYPTDCISDDANSTSSTTRPNINIGDDLTALSFDACLTTVYFTWINCNPSFMDADLIQRIEVCKRIECRISCFEKDPMVQACLVLYPVNNGYLYLNRLSRVPCDRPALYTLAYTYCEIQPCLLDFLSELSNEDSTEQTYCSGPIATLRSCVPFSITPDCDEEMIEHATLVLQVEMDICEPYIWERLPEYTSDPPTVDACDSSTCVIPRNIVIVICIIVVTLSFL